MGPYGAPSAPTPDPEAFRSLGLAIGVVRGYRAFRISPELFLTGIYHQQVYGTGEHHAQCWRRTRQYPQSMEQPPENVRPDIELGHMPTCECGFYGYYEGSNDYYKRTQHQFPTIAGMIEGYGETLIGPRGFRCTKMRIVALERPGALPVTRDARTQGPVIDFPGIMKHYEGIPVFDNLEAMLKVFPTEDGGAAEQAKRQGAA